MSSALQMLRIAQIPLLAVTEYQTKVCKLFGELNRYDNSGRNGYGVSTLQSDTEKGQVGDVILTIGIEARFTSVQQSGKLRIAPNCCGAEKCPQSTCVRLPITVVDWNQQKLDTGITPLDSFN